jgi:hypothetical protein
LWEKANRGTELLGTCGYILLKNTQLKVIKAKFVVGEKNAVYD